MKYSFYPGCSLHSTAKEYYLSTTKVADKLGIELNEIKDWFCCGATPAHNEDELLSLSLSAKNLAIAGENASIAVACASCYSRLKTAQYEVNTNLETRKIVEEAIEEPVPSGISVLHLIDIFVREYGLEKVKEKVVKPLTGLKVACYYGCLLTRPPKVTSFDDAERPVSMDNIISTIGADAVKWTHKTECCGASLTLSETDIVLELSGKILDAAKKGGADVVSVACPLCHNNLDVRQPQIEKFNKKEFGIPILYITQLVAIALGAKPSQLGLNYHMVDPFHTLKLKGVTEGF